MWQFVMLTIQYYMDSTQHKFVHFLQYDSLFLGHFCSLCIFEGNLTIYSM